MSNMPKDFYNKKYYFDVAYIEYTNSHSILTRFCERVSVYENHSKYAYAKCSTYLFKSHPHIKEIISIELLYSEKNN